MDLKAAEAEIGELYNEREKVMPLNRKAVTTCAAAIRQVHVGNIRGAKAMVKDAAALIAQLEKAVATEPRLEPFLGTPYQEYVELMVLISMVEEEGMPKLDVPADAYLLGSLDAVGELKRVCMELLAKGKRKEALALFGKMEEMYYSMEGYSFPNSLVPGFRHKQDAMKAVLERLHETVCGARMR